MYGQDELCYTFMPGKALPGKMGRKSTHEKSVIYHDIAIGMRVVYAGAGG